MSTAGLNSTTISAVDPQPRARGDVIEPLCERARGDVGPLGLVEQAEAADSTTRWMIAVCSPISRVKSVGVTLMHYVKIRMLEEASDDANENSNIVE